MAGANYMGGKRNTAKIRSKDATGRAQKGFFGKQRLDILAKGLAGTMGDSSCTRERQGKDKLSAINLAHAKNKLLFTEPSHLPTMLLILPSTPRWEEVQACSSSSVSSYQSSIKTRPSKILEVLDMSDPFSTNAACERVLAMPNLAGISRRPCKPAQKTSKVYRHHDSPEKETTNKIKPSIDSPSFVTPATPRRANANENPLSFEESHFPSARLLITPPSVEDDSLAKIRRLGASIHDLMDDEPASVYYADFVPEDFESKEPPGLAASHGDFRGPRVESEKLATAFEDFIQHDGHPNPLLPTFSPSSDGSCYPQFGVSSQDDDHMMLTWDSSASGSTVSSCSPLMYSSSRSSFSSGYFCSDGASFYPKEPFSFQSRPGYGTSNSTGSLPRLSSSLSPLSQTQRKQSASIQEDCITPHFQAKTEPGIASDGVDVAMSELSHQCAISIFDYEDPWAAVDELIDLRSLADRASLNGHIGEEDTLKALTANNDRRGVGFDAPYDYQPQSRFILPSRCFEPVSDVTVDMEYPDDPPEMYDLSPCSMGTTSTWSEGRPRSGMAVKGSGQFLEMLQDGEFDSEIVDSQASKAPGRSPRSTVAAMSIDVSPLLEVSRNPTYEDTDLAIRSSPSGTKLSSASYGTGWWNISTVDNPANTTGQVCGLATECNPDNSQKHYFAGNSPSGSRVDQMAEGRTRLSDVESQSASMVEVSSHSETSGVSVIQLDNGSLESEATFGGERGDIPVHFTSFQGLCLFPREDEESEED